MTNYFLKVNKDFFKLGLNPTEILILAQIMEFQNNTGNCFIGDSVLASNFGVSESTITRALKSLETKGFITRVTRNVKSGKERHIVVNVDKIEKQLTTVKMTDGKNATSVKMTDGQASICLLGNSQNDLIKDNIKDKEKDNNSEEFQPSAKNSSLQEAPKVKPKVCQKVSKQWLEENKIEYELVVGSLGYIKATGAIIEVI